MSYPKQYPTHEAAQAEVNSLKGWGKAEVVENPPSEFVYVEGESKTTYLVCIEDNKYMHEDGYVK